MESLGKVSVSRDAENYTVTFKQEGQLGITCHEADLLFVLRAFNEDEECVNTCSNGRIGVNITPKTVILYNLVGRTQRNCIVMSHAQTDRLAEALKKSYNDLLTNTYHPKI